VESIAALNPNYWKVDLGLLVHILVLELVVDPILCADLLLVEGSVGMHCCC